MAIQTRHLVHQLPVIASLGGTAFAALRQRFGGRPPRTPVVPGPELRATVAPPPKELLKDYIRHTGGDPGSYSGVVPPHLFPQWGFPLGARTLRDLPYPLAKVLNGGCRLEIHGDLPAGQPLQVAARLEDIDDNGRRAVLKQRIVTGTAEAPALVVGTLFAIVPLGGKRGGGEKPAPARVPTDALELAYWRLPADAGLAFAMLTGDFNPVHWVPAYARAFGFRSTILHGFATMARAIEGLNRGRFAGDARRLAVFDCKFTRPLVLPARVGLYLRGQEVWVGDAPGGPAYLAATFQTRDQ